MKVYSSRNIFYLNICKGFCISVYSISRKRGQVGGREGGGIDGMGGQPEEGYTFY